MGILACLTAPFTKNGLEKRTFSDHRGTELNQVSVCFDVVPQSKTLKWSFSSADGGIETMKVASSSCNQDESGVYCCSFSARSGFDAACWNS